MKKTTLILLAAIILTAIPVFAGNGDLIVTGNLGVGTTTPNQKVSVAGNVSVAGVVESTNGGVKFPDGTVQATAARLSMSDTFGCAIANNATTPARDIDVLAGRRRSDDDGADIVLAAAMTKRADQTWAAGTGNGGMQSGQSKVASKWYDVFLIYNPTGPAFDIQFCRMDTAFVFPTGYTKKRRLGSFRTNGSSNIIAFLQDGDYFWWANPVTESTTAGTITLTVPGGSLNGAVKVKPIVYTTGTHTGDPSYSAAVNWGYVGGTANKSIYGQGVCQANTSSQVLFSPAADTIDIIQTAGWIDNRGRDL
jgi:hypothetical protein